MLQKTTPGMAGRCCNGGWGESVFRGQRADFSTLQESNCLGKLVVVFGNDLAGLDFYRSPLFFSQLGTSCRLEAEYVDGRFFILFFSFCCGKLLEQMSIEVSLAQLERGFLLGRAIVEHDIGRDAFSLDRTPVRRVVARGGQFERGIIAERQ